MRKTIKFLFMSITLLVVLFATAAVVIPIMYKDQLLTVVKKELNEHLDAQTDFKDISLSLFSHFPYLSVGIKDICITGKETFKKDTLLYAKRIDLALDIKKALNGKYDIQKIELVAPRIHAVINKNGQANWNITKPAPATPAETASSSHFALHLKKYTIADGYLCYDDRQGKNKVILSDVNHTGSGTFDNEVFKLKTKTSIKEVTAMNGKIPYLNKVKADMDFDVDVDNKTNKYTFDTKDIKINGLNLSAKGYVQLPDTSRTLVDLQFNTPSNDFKDILSLVPGMYKEDFKDIQTTGSATLEGTVKGEYSQHRIPTFRINLGITNASFQYPSLPQKISDIQVALTASNPDGVPDHTVIDLKKGHMNFGPEPVDFRLLMMTPVSNARVSAYAKGTINLTELDKFVKLDKDTHISGMVTADVTFDGALANAEHRVYDSLNADGTVALQNFTYASKEFPGTLSISNLLLQFSPDSIAVTGLKASYLNTQFNGEGRIHNLLGYYLHKGTLTGALRLTADRIDGNQWKKSFTSPKGAAPAPAAPETAFVAPADLDITFDAQVDEIEYDHVKIKNVQGSMQLGNEIINIKDVQAHALEGEVTINGYYSSVADKTNPALDFEYIVSMGRINVMKRHITSL